MNGNVIYTTGYAGKDINDLKPLLEDLDALLVDIRFLPESDVLHWRQVYLKALLGRKYLHIPNLGIRSFRQGNQNTIQNLGLGIKILLGLERSLALMCACAELAKCHRRLIAEELRRRGISAVEIDDWKTRNSIR